jgi:5-(carboxyamino)imidazole ribonucleotide mutase
MSDILVGILMGSKSDLPKMQEAVAVLDELGIGNEVKVMSAHRQPELVRDYAAKAQGRGLLAIICGAGMAAHLAGAVAAGTTLPVIGVPIKSGALDGMDALLSTVMMPTGVPVATVAIDGAKNAAYLAAQIVANNHPEMRDKLNVMREKMAGGTS